MATATATTPTPTSSSTANQQLTDIDQHPTSPPNKMEAILSQATSLFANPHSEKSCKQILRVHLISAQFPPTAETHDAYAVVTVGKQSAKTFVHPMVSQGNDKVINWQEHFMIEHAEKDSKSLILIQVFQSNQELLGEYKMHLGDLPKCKDKKKEKAVEKNNQPGQIPEKWVTAKVNTYALKDKNGNDIGLITLRIRRETKMYGILNFELKEVTLDKLPKSLEADCVKCIVKLTTQVFESPPMKCTSGEGKIINWENCKYQFNIDETNHFSDVFIEVWRENVRGPPTQSCVQHIVNAVSTAAESVLIPGGKQEARSFSENLIGEARMSLFDTQSTFCTPMPLFRPHHKEIGTVTVMAKLTKSKKSKKSK